MNDKLNEMLQMQVALNKAICKEKNLTLDSIGIENVKTALLDEIGELTHELKGNWCWWKKTQEPVNHDRVLEELVDCWHFALTINQYYFNEVVIAPEGFLKQISSFATYSTIVKNLLACSENAVNEMVILTFKLGFTIDDVYDAYTKKNKVNYERLKNGY